MIKIIGTGLTGLVGSRIVELLENTYDFINFSLESKIDITDFTSLETAFIRHPDARAVLHLAAFTDVDAAWKQQNDQQGACYRVNVIGTKNIAKLCQKYTKYLIHISTDFVFDGQKETSYTETDQPQPIEWYGQTKYWAEQAVKKECRQWTMIRFAFPYKLRPSKQEISQTVNDKKAYKLDLVRKMIVRLKAGQRLALFDDQIITPTFIDDIAAAIHRIIQQKPKQEIFHCSGSKAITPYAIGRQLTDLLRLDKQLVVSASLVQYGKDHPQARPYQKNLVLSCKKLYNWFQLKPIGILEGLEKYII